MIVRQLSFLVLMGLTRVAVSGQPVVDSVEKRNLFDLFATDALPDLTLTADFDSIKSNIRNKEYVQGSFEVKHSRKNITHLKVKLRPRGKSRRMMCDFPPLKLKFEKQGMEAAGLHPFNDYKLVTHCMEGELAGEAVIRREFLVYQLYNILSPHSFKAKLVNISYKNTGSSFRKSTHLGIIIEDAESLAHRNNCNTLESSVIHLDSLHRNQEKLASVFQYMIGNADWSYMMGRNIELIKQSEGLIIPVPYDFDYAGLVRAPYARANSSLGQQTVLDRVFLGNAKSYEELEAILRYFKSKKDDLLEVIEDFDALSPEEAYQMKAYILGFYEIIESKEKVEKVMLGRISKE